VTAVGVDAGTATAITDAITAILDERSEIRAISMSELKDASGVWETIGKIVAEEKGGAVSVEIWIQEVTPDNQLTLNRIALPERFVGKIEKTENGESDFVLAEELDLVPGSE
jgi:hypothetical protein